MFTQKYVHIYKRKCIVRYSTIVIICSVFFHRILCFLLATSDPELSLSVYVARGALSSSNYPKSVNLGK